MTVGIAAQNSGVNTGFASAATSAVPYPATTHAGGVLILFMSILGVNTSVTTPTGWTLLKKQGGTGPADGTGTTAPTIRAFIRNTRATGSEGGTSLSVSHASGVGNRGVIVEYLGVDPATPLDAAVISVDDTSSNATIVCGGITVATQGATVVYAASTNTATQTQTTSISGFTERSDSSGTNCALAVSDAQNLAPGTRGNGTSTFSGSGKGVMIMIALRPAFAWSEWDGSTEHPLTLEGEWTGSVVAPLSFEKITV